jgi:radical SAM superfamily enzyme YgiQ (UPF0313 family)
MISLINVNSLKIPSLPLATLKIHINNDVDVKISDFDISDNSTAEFIKFSRSLGKNDIVGFSVSSYNIKSVLNYSKILGEENSGVCIIFGGPMVSSIRYSIDLLNKHPEIDYILRGRADITFSKLINFLLNNNSGINNPLDIPNTTYRINDKPFAAPDEKENNPNFAKISPWLKEYNYLINDYMITSNDGLPYSTGYGCPNGCTYCVESKQEFVMYPIERIQEELKLILSYKLKKIFLYDSTLGYSKTRAMEIIDTISKYNKSTIISAYINAKWIDTEFCKLSHNAGIDLSGIGLQTINDKTCSIIKRTTPETKGLLKKINSDYYQKYNNTWIGIIYGLPGEGYKEFRTSLNYALSLSSNFNLGLYRYCYYPGTSLYENELNYKPKSDIDPEIIEGPSITKDQILHCNKIASSYWIIRQCFSFTLMFITHVEKWERVKIIEEFSEKILDKLSLELTGVINDIAFANKSKDSQASLQPIIDTIRNNPEYYCQTLAAIFVYLNDNNSVSIINLLKQWLILDIKYGKYLTKDIRYYIEKNGKLGNFVRGILSKSGENVYHSFFYKSGLILSNSRSLQWSIIIFIKLFISDILIKSIKKIKR